MRNRKPLIYVAAAVVILIAVIASFPSHKKTPAVATTAPQPTAPAVTTSNPQAPTTTGVQYAAPATTTTASVPTVTQGSVEAPAPKPVKDTGCWRKGGHDPFDQLDKVARQRLTVAWQTAKANGVDPGSGKFYPPRVLEPRLHSRWVRFALAYGPQSACGAGTDLALLDAHSTATALTFYERSDSRTIWKLVGGTGPTATITRLDQKRSRRYVVTG